MYLANCSGRLMALGAKLNETLIIVNNWCAPYTVHREIGREHRARREQRHVFIHNDTWTHLPIGLEGRNVRVRVCDNWYPCAYPI